MAGDWIKMRSDLFSHPKVVRISSALKADTLRTVGGLMSAWCLFDRHAEDGKLEGYALQTLDDHLRWPGFANAMILVGWLEIDEESLVLPRFDTHNGQSAKRRAQDSDRKNDVRKMSASEADKKRTREEKRRVYKNPIVPSAETQKAVLSAYHEILPDCQRVEVLNPKRLKRIAEAERMAIDVCQGQGWEYQAEPFWDAYFSQCSKDLWLAGKVANPNNAAWKQHLGVLIDEDRFATVMDKAISSLRSRS